MVASFHTIDTCSDVLFIINITHQSQYPSPLTETIFANSILFVILLVMITLFQLHQATQKWRRNDDLCQWINDNIVLLYILSVITGSSFTGVELCTSNIFNSSKFDMPLNKMALDGFKTKRLYSTVFFEVCLFPIFLNHSKRHGNKFLRSYYDLHKIHRIFHK